MNDLTPDFSLVIPACNEELRIRPTLDAYLDHFGRTWPGRHEVLVVVNGSSDRTEEIVRAYADQHAHLRLIVIPERVGKGGAVLRGLRESRGARVAFVDADGATAPAELDRLAGLLADSDVVIGSRWLPGAVVTRRQSLGRRIASRLFNGLVRLLFGLRLRDTQCGAKLFRRPVLDAILPSLGVSHWVFDVDLLYQAQRAGFRIREEPTVRSDVDGSTLRASNALFDVVYALLRLRLLFSPLRPAVEAWDRLVGRRAFEQQLRSGRLAARSRRRPD